MTNFIFVLKMMGLGILNLIPYAILALPFAIVTTHLAVRWILCD